MKIKDIVPLRKNGDVMLKRSEVSDPFFSFHTRLDRLFDDFMGDFGRLPMLMMDHPRSMAVSPNFDISEDSKEIVVSAELPGMEEKDVEILLSADELTIKGEKKMEKEEKGREYYRKERMYGSFSRSFSLPTEVERDRVSASYKQGVLKVTLPKSATAQKEMKKIEIKKE